MEARVAALNLIVPLLFLLTAAYLGTTLIRSYVVARLQFSLTIKLHQHLLRRISRLSFTYTSEKESGYLASRILQDTEAAHEFATTQLVSLLQQALTLLVALTAMAWISWPTALVSVVIVPLHILIGSAFIPRLRRQSRECLEKRAQREKILYETISGMYTINTCCAEPQMLRRFLSAQITLVRAQMRQFWLRAKVNTARSLAVGSGPLVVLWFGGLQVIYGHMSIGDLVAFSGIFGFLFDAARSLSTTHLALQGFIVALERLFEILGQEPGIREREHPAPLKCIERGINFRNVVFGYEGGEPTLRGLNLCIPAGKITALAGRSGVGKTTLVHLLMRFYEPDSGDIEIDGRPLRDFSLRSLRRTVALVPQDVFLFSMTVEENIRLGNPTASREKVVEAATLAGAHHFIQKLPDGYESRVGERGMTLSGGERQRIAIARALLTEPQVLVLDEAVSSVDGAFEQVICDTVRHLNADRGITVIVIAHRRSTIQQADVICLIEGGQVVAHGTHPFLLQYCPSYAEMVQFQLTEPKPSFDWIIDQQGIGLVQSAEGGFNGKQCNEND
jgi:ABC-type bacteriocin/lantibiotic exporter with double-glycine peptidase domain